ncbi:MAG: hypothetical protein IJX81_05870 [Clostridia bacterium]|nr:hypothetical protein [Clostridia bacterium]
MSKKRRVLDATLEILLELGITILCLLIGFLILWAFGVDLTAETLDFELVALLGAVVFIVVFFALYALVYIRKKKKNKKGEDTYDQTD